MRRYLLVFFALLVVGLFVAHAPAAAQTGMTKATAVLLVTDLIQAGFEPLIREEGGKYVIIVSTTPDQAGTAAQVQTFANNRSVVARVLTVQFE